MTHFGRSPLRQGRAGRGQSMLIFALSAAVIFAVVGLSIDAGVGYFNSTLEERAAEAAALAGVTDMPNGWATGSVAGQVTILAQQNGFAATATAAEDGMVATGANGLTVSDFQVPSTCGGAGQSPCVAQPNQCGGVSQPDCARNRLLVQVCVEVPATFLALVGFGNHVECQQATAEYLSPITLGQPGSQLGTDLTALGTGGTNYYFLRSEGWNSDRAQGDAFTPSPLDDNTNGGNGTYPTPDTLNPTGAADEHSLNETTSPATDVPLSDFPFGTLSVDERGGQNYLIQIPPGQSDVVDVYNPVFGPDADSNATDCNLAKAPNGQPSTATNEDNYNYHECDGDFSNTSGDSGLAAAEMYSAMSYSLFSVPDIFNDSGDQLISQTMAFPIDARDWNTGAGEWYDVAHGGNGGAAPFGKEFKGAMPSVWQQWVNICAPPQVTGDTSLITAKYGTINGVLQNASDCVLTNNSSSTEYYRLRVDTLDYNGQDGERDSLSAHSEAHKGYAVEVTASGGGSCSLTTPGCEIGALNDLAIYTPISVGVGSSGSFSVPLVSIPPEYAGEDVYVDIFDPGDVSCTGTGGNVNDCNLISIYQPGGTQVATLGAKGATWLGPSIDDPSNAICYVGSSSPQCSGGANDCAGGATGSTDVAGQPAIVSTRCKNNSVTNNTGNTNLYNGTWVSFDIAVPPGYDPGSNPNGWFWDLKYTLTGSSSSAGDTITVTAGFNGSPLHLVGG